MPHHFHRESYQGKTVIIIKTQKGVSKELSASLARQDF